jgi:hypothetical protein
MTGEDDASVGLPPWQRETDWRWPLLWDWASAHQKQDPLALKTLARPHRRPRTPGHRCSDQGSQDRGGSNESLQTLCGPTRKMNAAVNAFDGGLANPKRLSPREGRQRRSARLSWWFSLKSPHPQTSLTERLFRPLRGQRLERPGTLAQSPRQDRKEYRA